MRPSCSSYLLPEPYPVVGAVRPDPQIVRRLLEEYAGGNGALTAITQYFYNGLLAPTAGQPALGDLFSCVSMVEMQHMRQLAMLILAYGGDPRLLSYGRGGRPMWWTGANVSYTNDPALMLRSAINAERAAILSYRRTLSMLREEDARALLERLIADEEHHIALFTDALAAIPTPLASKETRRRC